MFFDLFYVFYFFNQKTAYVLRISDWSSDVCSSDLGQVDAHDDDRHHGEGGGHRNVAGGYLMLQHQHADERPGIADDAEIGSASCRERVVSVRVDLGGRRILKKNNITNQIQTR